MYYNVSIMMLFNVLTTTMENMIRLAKVRIKCFYNCYKTVSYKQLNQLECEYVLIPPLFL